MSDFQGDSELDAVLAKLKSVAGMETPNGDELNAWRTKLEKSADYFDALGNRLKEKAMEYREKMRAVDVLLGKSAQRVTASSNSGNAHASDQGASFTPVDAYWHPTLESLVDLGGR